MQTGNPFSIKFVTYDHNRKKGGRIVHYPEAIITQSKTTKKKEAQTSIVPAKKSKTVNPNHWKNATRGLKILVNGVESETIRRFHVFLMLEFNGQKVIT